MGAQKMEQYTNLTSCQTYCIASTQCVAVDFDDSLKQCWVHNSTNNLSPENTYNLPAAHQYILNRTCPTGKSISFIGLASDGSCNEFIFQPLRLPRME